jgi:hypothetical protein
MATKIFESHNPKHIEAEVPKFLEENNGECRSALKEYSPDTGMYRLILHWEEK